MKKRRVILWTVFGLIIILLIPLIFNERGHQYFEGTKLTEVEYSEVFYTNEQDNLGLAGMLMLPNRAGPFPTVVIVQGSGPSFRDNWWTLYVVKHLQDNGIAVLIPDKRGCEKSQGKWIGASFDALANDVISAVDYIKGQQDFKASTIGLVGISQGGWIAPVGATKSEDISFLVSLSGPTVTAYEQLLHEETHTISGYTYPFIAKWIAPITTKRLQNMEHLKAYADFDPVPYLKQIDVPALFAFGGGDKLVPVNTSIDRLKENGLDNFDIRTYPNGGHALVDIETNKVSEKCLGDVTDFIKGID